MVVLCAWALAFGQAPQAETTWSRFAAVASLEAEPARVRPLEAPLTIREGPATYRLSGGYLVPVFGGQASSTWTAYARELAAKQREQGLEVRIPTEAERGSREVVGVLWVGGTGTVTVDLDDRADGMLFANSLVLAGHAERDDVVDIAHGRAPLTASVTELAWISVDPAVDAAFAGPEGLDPYELVVFGATNQTERLAARVARRFDERLDLFATQFLFVANRIAWDRIDQAQATVGPKGTFALVDALTDRRLAQVAPNQAGPADRWLTAVRDESGAVDTRRRVRISARGVSGRGRLVDALIGGEVFPGLDPDDPTSAPLPPVRAVGESAKVIVGAVPEGNDARVEVTSDLTFRAVGGPISRIELRIRKADPNAKDFEFVDARLMDGTPLLGQAARTLTLGPPEPNPDPTPRPPVPPDGDDDRPPPPPRPDRLDPVSFAIVELLLPQPLPAGEVVTVRTQHRDRWALTNLVEIQGIGFRSLGTSSGLQEILPAVTPTPPGGTWNWDITVKVPETSKWRPAVTGRTVAEGVQGGWYGVRAQSEREGRWPSVVIGKFVLHKVPPVSGMPGVRVNLLPDHYNSIHTFGPEIRRVVNFYQGFLPKFPVGELEVVESPRQHGGGFTWVAPHGMVAVQKTMKDSAVYKQPNGPNLRNDLPRLEESIFSHEIAHQYWGHLAPPATAEDFWISETMSEAFSCLYVGHAFKHKDCVNRMVEYRRRWTSRTEDLLTASLTRAYENPWRQPDIVYRYGPVTLLDGLQRQLGPGVFFGALDRLLRDHPYEPLTTERLQAYFERASGRDLGNWFDFYVHGGYLPRLRVQWQAQGRRVKGTVAADVPFGTFDVPIRVLTKSGPTDRLVTVTDGVGPFVIDVPDAKVKGIEVDPAKMIITRSIRVERRP